MSTKPSPGLKGSEAGTPLFTCAQAAVGTPGISSAALSFGSGTALAPGTPEAANGPRVNTCSQLQINASNANGASVSPLCSQHVAVALSLHRHHIAVVLPMAKCLSWFEQQTKDEGNSQCHICMAV